ncbi:hypothetical protein PTE31013_00234 [Pandoraea terrigena]|uniref:Uncharacterized protein n=1 Tax=Pandoraea terrigena TaxID=2508292 RepID=A0A5E4RKL0_9BURK|nr:hypothetical protein PTE31013_00234 [Pandoraea terrigena]
MIAQNTQRLVQLLAMRRRDSHGNLHSLAQVANRPVAAVTEWWRPGAPPLDHGDFRADFVSSRAERRALLSLPRREGRAACADAATQTDAAWEAPPPYLALDAMPGAAGPGMSRGGPTRYDAAGTT